MTPVTHTERRQKIIHRIHRIQGQLNGLQRAVEEARDCEQLITQARAIEKAVASLVVQMIEGHLVYHICEMPYDDPEQTIQTLTRLIELSHR